MGDLFAGIDSGFTHMGVTIAEVDGEVMHVKDIACFSTEPIDKARGFRVADDNARRCADLSRNLAVLLRKHQVRGALVEIPTGAAGKGSFRPNSRAIMSMGFAMAVPVAVLTVLGIPAQWVIPEDIKVTAAGKRSATKQEVQEGVLKALDWSKVDGRRGFLKPLSEWEHIADGAGALLVGRGWAQSPFRALDAPPSSSSAARRATPSDVNQVRGAAEDRAGAGFASFPAPARQRRRS